MHLRHLTREQRDNLIRKLRRKGMTLQEVADAVGINVATAQRATATFANAKVDPVVGADGRVRPAHYAPRQAKEEETVDPYEYNRQQIIEANLERRHLTASQRAMAARLGVARRTVGDWLDAPNGESAKRRAKHHDSRVKIPRSEYPVIYRRIKSGETQAQVAADYGVGQPARHVGGQGAAAAGGTE